jgi:hypothetical protein
VFVDVGPLAAGYLKPGMFIQVSMQSTGMHAQDLAVLDTHTKPLFSFIVVVCWTSFLRITTSSHFGFLVPALLLVQQWW